MSGVSRLRLSKKPNLTKRWYPAEDEIAPDGLSAGGSKAPTKMDFVVPKKNSPFTNYAPKTAPPEGRALPVRGEHED